MVPPFLRERRDRAVCATPGYPLSPPRGGPPPRLPVRPPAARAPSPRPPRNGTLKWRRPPPPAGRGLRSVPSLSRFHRLRYLWINNNKIQDLTFLIKNYCLTELYLNNNELTDISDLFHNPLAQDPDYRLHVIYFLPSVQLLDRKSVTQRERESALHLYNRERSCAVQSIAFGRRVNTPLGATVGSSRCSQPARRLMMPSGCEFGNHTNKVPFENPEDAVLLRAMTRSLMEFSSVDWNKVATCQERRLENKAEEAHEKLTVQFR
ncbi:leucine-rich repeat-containing protein 72 isoform X4 [Aquila chrysaetos chrysaetos]|uniref:leucine-rich repeat-containing protein 72 isoform X4 n=1 Tax=Aquila chrysaetos chrysaetos TaxID=223781 RepID=UPI0011767D9C|nr:leucine-rich repeat-containing protein 72 isoform X4 [Aquila chrysaetos chrysaetos]